MKPVWKVVLILMALGWMAWGGHMAGYRQGYVNGVADCITETIVGQLPIGPRAK